MSTRIARPTFKTGSVDTQADRIMQSTLIENDIHDEVHLSFMVSVCVVSLQSL